MRKEIRCQRAAQCVSPLVALAATFTATGCSGQSSENRPGDSVGRPNPAAVFCQEQGGEYLLETGECRLADGTVRDAWEYFQENAEPGAPD
jgi:putative hemolysin